MIKEHGNNLNFNCTEFDKIRNAAGSNSFVLSVKALIQRTGTIGIMAKAAPHNDGKRGDWWRRAAVLSPLPQAFPDNRPCRFLIFFLFPDKKGGKRVVLSHFYSVSCSFLPTIVYFCS